MERTKVGGRSLRDGMNRDNRRNEAIFFCKKEDARGTLERPSPIGDSRKHTDRMRKGLPGNQSECDEATTMAHLDALTLFGFASSVAMILCYAFEERSHWLTLAFAASCAMASAYGFLQGAWPVGLSEVIWTLVAFNRWRLRKDVRRGLAA